ncbi:MAG: sugar transferase [Planctomycetales bacterium]|nr:sugar transferase [Planctomycetales bacterium]
MNSTNDNQFTLFGKLTQSLSSFLRAAEPANALGLKSVAEMNDVLARERARSDRSGSTFSLIAFAPNEAATPSETLPQLAQVIRKRVRSFDDAGWLEPEILGIVLAGADAQGAWTVADDIRTSLPAGSPAPACRVYTYPTNTWNGRDDDHAELEAVCQELLAGDSETPTCDTAPEAVEPRAVHAMEQLFEQPTPLAKRAVDVVGAAIGLSLLTPLFAIVAVAIKITSPGPIFFFQKRSGRGGRPFDMVKFRSMVVDAESRKAELMAQNEQDGPAFKIKNDPRMTSIGRFIRATSIDELPQLWNVLRGDMSLVGPRPLPCNETEGCQPWQKQRLDVTPGLTCIWQVSGRAKVVSFADWVRMDVRYIRNRSLLADFRLILATLPAMVAKKGH